MLGKLIKHELKANSKLILITHGFILLFSLLLAASILLRSMSVESGLSLTTGFMSFYIVLLFVAMTAISVFGIHIYIGVRFYKNFFTDEGYLMHTLPTTPTQLLHSKIITGAILMLFNLLIVGISAVIVYYPLITQSLGLGDSFISAFSNLSAVDVISVCGSYLLTYATSLLQIYACICIGQLFHKNRLVAAIVVFLGSNFIQSIISLILSLSTNATVSYSVNTTSYDTANTYTSNLSGLNVPSFIVSVLFISLFYWISHYIMNKKLNLV